MVNSLGEAFIFEKVIKHVVRAVPLENGEGSAKRGTDVNSSASEPYQGPGGKRPRLQQNLPKPATAQATHGEQLRSAKREGRTKRKVGGSKSQVM